MNESIDGIFNELKIKGLINRQRKLKPTNVFRNFCVIPFLNTIYYDSKLSEVSDNTIRFFLLHEEGHLVLKHSILKNMLMIIGIITFTLNLIWFSASSIITTLYFNVNIFLILLFVALFFSLFSTKLFATSLQLDEFIADVFAAEKIRDEFQNNQPSIIVKTAFNEIADFYERIDKNCESNFLITIFSPLIEYHPTNQQRVANVIYRVDERNR
ncbi:MAG: M48 family metalloprotease [Methanoregula sp.]|nr:M48 family metalloprotease [Methanoregula sp.]